MSRTVLILCLIAPLFAQMPADPLSEDARWSWNNVKTYIVKAADKMAADDYSFRPTPQVRTFGEIVGHIVDGHYLICGAEKGEKRTPTVEKTKKSKEELVGALNESIEYCDASYNEMNDKKAVEVINFFGRSRARVSVLQYNNSHDNEHYGNLVTYMRIKGLTPPSSEPRK